MSVLVGTVILSVGSLTAIAPTASAALSGGPSIGLLAVTYTAGREIEERDSTSVSAAYPLGGPVNINAGDPLSFELDHLVHGFPSTGFGNCGGVYNTTSQGSQPWPSFYVNPVAADQAGVSPAHSGYLLPVTNGTRSYTDTYLCHDGGLTDPTVTNEYSHKETTQGTLDTTTLPPGCYELDTYVAESLDSYSGRSGNVARFSVGGVSCGGTVATDDQVTVAENQLGPEPTPYRIDWTVGDYDPDGEAVSLVSAAQPLHGKTETVGDSLLYTPLPGFSGTDQFLYTITDPHGAQASAKVYVTVTPVCDRAFTTGTVEATHHPAVTSEYLSFSMNVPWCHDGQHAVLPGGIGSVALVTGETGLENDPVFVALSGLVSFQIDPVAGKTVATAVRQPDGSMIVEGRTAFHASVDAVQVAMSFLPEFGVLGKLQEAFAHMPPKARVAFVHALAGRLIAGLSRVGVTTVVGAGELPDFALALEQALSQILSTDVGHVLSLPVGVDIWSPVFRFQLFPGGSATYTIGGDPLTYFTSSVTDFQNHP